MLSGLVWNTCEMFGALERIEFGSLFVMALSLIEYKFDVSVFALLCSTGLLLANLDHQFD